ncbi:HAMP domain-containing sensor histidine kinase [Larkinella sp. C7]|uniref:sensor histidine kinase n=1 Tax=Larkinella sp. C7 TaxID=2576607 RepID=UPI001111138A|nr:HAMP domain-containing sensor histidine kinase [Larkinella sp. C7]
MKLLHKMMLNLVLVAIPVAIGGVWLFYTMIHAGIQYEVDEQLSSDLLTMRQQFQRSGQYIGRINPFRVEIDSASLPIPATFADTTEFDPRENEVVPVRRLVVTVQASGKPGRLYRISIRQPVGEFNEIARLLSIGVTLTFLVLVVVLMALNGWLIRRLWQPFYQLIDQLRHYRLEIRSNSEHQPVSFSGSTTDEFNQLSAALNTMSRNLQEQFMTQRQFTDNAAHEMQTPLAILSHELENLLSIEPLSMEQMTGIERAQDSIRRLVRLNKSLLLLTRIENHQFADEQVNISPIVDELARVYHDFANHHELKWEYNLAPDVYQTMNPYLAEVLFSNLMQNAVRYSEPNAKVEMTLTPSYFQIQNPGTPLPFPSHQVFDRFIKNPAFPDSTGLGLALVQQIAQLHGMRVNYDYLANTQIHLFRVDFPKANLLSTNGYTIT